MPKRKNEDKIERYQRKLKKLLKKQHKYSSSSDNSDKSDTDSRVVLDPDQVESAEHMSTSMNDDENKVDDNEQPIPELDSDIRCALGETTEELPTFGPKIHESLSKLWLPILKKGLNKEVKEKLNKQYLIPEKCALLQAPKLNPEISSAINEGARARDKRVEAVQQQLGRGIAALNKGLEMLLDDGNDKLQATKFLSDSCRILCDLHQLETEARKKFIAPSLDRTFLSITQEVDRDELLFGNKLSEKIKATKVIEKHGLQIKKAPPNVKTHSNTSAFQPSTSHVRHPGNWRGPPRFPSNRGGRGGQKRQATTASRKAPLGGFTQQRQNFQNKPSARPSSGQQ